jgi:hypothetical protein
MERCACDWTCGSDTLWGFKSQQNSQFASWNRFRATVDVDFGKLAGPNAIEIVFAQLPDCFASLAMTTIAVHGFPQLHA